MARHKTTNTGLKMRKNGLHFILAVLIRKIRLENNEKLISGFKISRTIKELSIYLINFPASSQACSHEAIDYIYSLCSMIEAILHRPYFICFSLVKWDDLIVIFYGRKLTLRRSIGINTGINPLVHHVKVSMTQKRHLFKLRCLCLFWCSSFL